ncbi:DUF3103 family protein [Jatrophihabitans sp.]|uniref:DUF3103 family protein n=1 Tax=Jatrophihabitans sp. TaxID=1932789 RepID=UPI002C04D21B|nr:DUF3103 family protein [Jatrophihabitans sp.]
MTALAVASASTIGINSSAVAAPAKGSASQSAAGVNQSLDALAKLFARAMADQTMRQNIHAAVAKRFDGDTEALYTSIAGTSDVRSRLAAAYSHGRAAQYSDAVGAVDRLAGSIPRFQVAVPAHFDSWDPASYTPLVAYMPAGVEDTTLKTVTAYDAAGKAHTLDAQVAPARPVVVLGLNERTDNSGKLLNTEAVSTSRDAMTTGQLALATTSYQVRMVKVHLIHDNEPWTKGSAEISLRAQGCGLSYTDIDWSSLNDDEDIWVGTRELGTATCGVIFSWWEDDGNTWDFTLSYGSVSLGVHMDDGDDLIGDIKLDLSTFEGGTNKMTPWSDLEQWTD